MALKNAQYSAFRMSRPTAARPAPVSELRTVFIGNVAFDVTEDELRSTLGQFGQLNSLRVVTDRDTGKRKGFAFAEFFDPACAAAAVRSLNEYEMHGRTLRVSMAEQDTQAGGGSAPSRKRKGGADGGLGLSRGGPSATPMLPPSLDGAQIMKLSEAQLWEIVCQMKAVVEQDVEQARSMLIASPAVGLAILKAQYRLGMVSAEHINKALAAANAPAPRPLPPPPQPLMPPPPPLRPPPPPPPPRQEPESTGGAEQQALIAQLMQLSPEQIQALPAEQRAQVEALRRSLGYT